MAIDSISSRAFAPQTPSLPSRTNEAQEGGFGSTLKSFIDSVDKSDAAANSAINEMINGRGDVHHAMIAMQQSEAMLQLAVQVRNKLVTAYQDIMRMPI
jgi:flagellar hook-basal body complex protein FliE